MDYQNKITFRKFQRKFKNYEYDAEWRLFLNGKQQKEYYICMIGGYNNAYAYCSSICTVGELQYFDTLIEAKRSLAKIFNINNMPL